MIGATAECETWREPSLTLAPEEVKTHCHKESESCVKTIEARRTAFISRKRKCVKIVIHKEKFKSSSDMCFKAQLHCFKTLMKPK